MPSPVPNYVPHSPAKPRLALIGEAPGSPLSSRPFDGAQGALLAQILTSAGLDMGRCFLGYVSQHTFDVDLKRVRWDDEKVQAGLAQLTADLRKFKPSVIVLLGPLALRAAFNGGKVSLEDLRGSILHPEDCPFGSVPLIATHSPAAAFKDFGLRYTIRGDIGRAVIVLAGKQPAPPAERYLIDVPADVASATLKRLRKSKALVAADLEGYPGDLRCIAIAWSPEDAIVIGGDTLAEPRLRREFEEFCADPRVRIIWHNGLYDRFVLGWEPWNMRVPSTSDDTMLAQWELACEFPKSLGYCGSVHLWRPYWKGDKSTPDRLTLQRYCARDTTGTWELFSVQMQKLEKEPGSLKHYRFNMRTLAPLLEMELSGIRYDVAGAARRRAELQQQAYALQAELDGLTGAGLNSREEITKALLGMCMVRAKLTGVSQINETVVRKEWREDLARIMELAARPTLSPADRGELSTLLKQHRNCESIAFRDYLYGTLKLPKQYKKTPKGPVLSCDETALLRLRAKSSHPAIPLALRLRNLNTRIGMLGIKSDDDGRIRCGYNPVGQETGRVSCYTSPTGSGYNLTTIPEQDRDLFLADEGCWLGQVDLAGADGWTVGANLYALGAPNLLEDLRAGLKPARVLVLMREDPANANLSREALLALSKTIRKDDIRYPIGKMAQHGTSYQMGAKTCANNVFLQSGGEIVASVTEMATMQGHFETRYRVRLWHGAVQRKLLADKSSLSVPSGHRRKFCNWPEQRLREALAHEPQANTTYATNLALVRCWEDPENMGPNGQRIVQLKHHIHDALLFQFPKSQVAFAKRKIAEWFNNTLIIAGLPIVIPYEGSYGQSWGSLKEGTL